jgi:sec-independent protein translocase protein TatC
MVTNLLDWLPRLPISDNAAVLISALLVSLTVAVVALIRNRRQLIGIGQEEEGDLGTVFENPGALLPHLLELRQRILNSLLGIAVATGLGMVLTQQILHILAEPIGGLNALQAIHVTEGVSVFFRVALTTGIVLASPFVIAQVWLFVASGLRPSERRLFYLLFPFGAILFLSGVAFAYLVMLPVAVPFLTTFMGITSEPTLDDYVKFITNVLLWIGLSFELPMVVFILAKAKLVNARTLLKQWRIAVVLIVALAAIVTPTPDPVNMAIVTAPMFVLYLLSVLLALLA